MDTFSFSDRVYAAVGSCLSCFGIHSHNEPDDSNTSDLNNGRIRRARSDELEGLLADVADTDTEAETMSLHSNIGEGRQRHMKRRGLKRITVFGWNLFGKPAIQLPEGDEDDLLRSRTRSRATQGTISSATLDSDAAPLESSAIEELSSEQAQERARLAEEEDRRLKEERRRRRKERKVIKRTTRALASGGGDGEFEGFQGSGDAYPRIPGPSKVPYTPASVSDSRDSRDSGYGPFVQGPETQDPDADDADLGGELYTRKAAPSGNSNGSDSRSRTSASQSQDNPERYNHHYISQQPQPHMVPLPSRSESSSLGPSSDTPRRKKKSKKSTQAKSASSTSNSQSSSLPSPMNTSFTTSPPPSAALPSSPLSMPHEEHLKPIPLAGQTGDKISAGFPSTGLGGGDLPSPGLGHGGLSSPGFSGPRRKNRDMGAFLATRGDS